MKGKADGNISGIKIDSSLKQASDIFECPPIFFEGVEIVFNSLDGVSFEIAAAKMDFLYEIGAVEDGELDEQCHDTKKLKIKKIHVRASQ